MSRLHSAAGAFCTAAGRSLAAVLLAGAALLPDSSANAYSLNGKTWPSGSEIVMRFGLGNSVLPLLDGHTSYDAAVQPVLDTWNSKMGRVRLAGANSTSAVSSGDRINSVVFSNTVFGQAFGTGTLAVTYYIMQGSSMVEADVLFNRAQTFESYRGPLRFGGGSGSYALADIRRVFLHELGHGLGLNHSDGDNVMAPLISDREQLSNDDVAGIQAMYGAPVVQPPPPPPPPSVTIGRLTNISTRLRVGVDANVAIGGFILRGAEAKRVILRASGPALASALPGTLGDPVLELYDSAGRPVASNDNWQSSAQAGEIAGSGFAPGNPLEAAIVATLPSGSYTAIVRGANGAQGIGLVEGYELDGNSTRLVNLSTRGRVGGGNEVMIGGVIVAGAEKRVMVRAVAPSLASVIPDTLADPMLELYNAAGQLVIANDNWNTSPQVNDILTTAYRPGSNAESAVIANLPPGNYTAIVRGASGGQGVALVEVYDLEP
jgi:hypothetical protein